VAQVSKGKDQRTCHHNADGSLIKIKVSMSIEFSLSVITSRRVEWQHTCSHLSDVIRQHDILSGDRLCPSVEHRHSQRGRLTKIFALGIPTPPAHVLVHARAHAEEVRIAALDGQGEGGDGQHCGGQREQPAEPHRVLSCLVLRCFRVD
jgi:hypothetical protein